MGIQRVWIMRLWIIVTPIERIRIPGNSAVFLNIEKRPAYDSAYEGLWFVAVAGEQ